MTASSWMEVVKIPSWSASVSHSLIMAGDNTNSGDPVEVSALGDKSAARKLEKLDRESFDSMNAAISALLDKEGVRGTEKKKVLDLINRYFRYYYSGTLAEAAGELKGNSCYEPMLRALWDYNYGPWIKEMIETTTHSARELEITFFPIH